jgi:hypothetical protein
LPVDFHVTLSDIIAHHTLFGMTNKLSPLTFPHLKGLDDFMVLGLNFINAEKLKLELCEMEFTVCIHYSSVIFLRDEN